MSKASTRFFLTLPGTAAATVTGWIALLSWHSFTNEPSNFSVPLLALALVVAGVGLLARSMNLPWWVTVLAQVGFGALAAHFLIDAEDGIRVALSDAVQTANQFAPPIPASAPPIDPLLIVSGLGCLIALDLLACGLRTPALAGLPLLAVYTIPVSITGAGIPWWVFVLTGLGFVAMLYIHERQRLAQWSRGADDPQALAPRTLQVHGNSGPIAAAAIGTMATAAALVIPLAIPTMGMSVFANGFGSGGSGGDIRVENPMTDLRRDLDPNRPDIPLLTITTEDPDPNYLRVAVLAQLSGTTFTPGDRRIPQDQTAQGTLPEPTGVTGRVQRRAFDYNIAVTENFESIWLPTALDISEIDADGDWRYDSRTRDFLRVGQDLTTAGMNYDFTKIDFDITGAALSTSQSAAGAVDPIFTGVPTDLPGRVRQLAQQVTAGATSNFERAVALQNWFRDPDNFTYDLTPTGSGDLMSFLSPNGRRGYCEQFATAMTVMARSLSIPARVGVGFLNPDQTGPTSYEFSSRDMHAWPELYFPGSGWVRFEPTPAARDGAVAPGYSNAQIPEVQVPEATAPTAQPSDDLPSRGSEAEPQPEEEPQAMPEVDTTSTDSGLPYARILLGTGLVLLLLLLACGPRLARRSRRRRRLREDLAPSAAWAEVRDSALDLGVRWRDGLSPRATGAWLTRHLGPTSASTLSGPGGSNPEPPTREALHRLVLALEQERYARGNSAGSAALSAQLRTDVASVEEALAANASRMSRIGARWWPRSIFRLRTSARRVRTEPTRVGPADVDVTANSGPGSRKRTVDRVG